MAAAVVVLAVPAVAAAAVSARLSSPASGRTVQAAVPIEVEVSHDLLDPPPEAVEVRLSADGGSAAAGTTAAALRCLEGCDEQEQRWGGVSFDPATGAPFAGAGICNGSWVIQPRVDDGPFAVGSRILVSAEPAPPRDVTAGGGADGATIAWRPPSTPDLTGFAVQRRADGRWRTVATLGAGATSHRDAAAPAGEEVAYRVQSLRGDGLSGEGRPLLPCADTEPDLRASSAAATAAIPAAAPDAEGSDQDPGRDAPAGSGDQAGGDGAAPAAGPAGADADGAGTDGEREVAAPPPTRPAAGDSSAPPSQAAPEVASPGGRDAGAEEGFSRELDYEGAEIVTPAPDRVTAPRTRRVPGGVSVFVRRHLDLERVVAPVAGGVLLLAVALRLRRWLNAPDDL